MTLPPRAEYPRPQFVRADWLCLNGTWEFETDAGDTGEARGLVQRPLRDRIVVPFCPESALSGISNTDHLNAVWYRRHVTVPASWQGRRVLLHFQACDYDTTVWLDGTRLGTHSGGFTPFSFELPETVTGGKEFSLTVRARDDHREAKPMGKQSRDYANSGCLYTRTTGIWQTVWLEPVAPTRLRRPRITPVPDAGGFLVACPLDRPRAGLRLHATLSDASGAVCETECITGSAFSPNLWVSVPQHRARLWHPRDPHLYQLTLHLTDPAGETLDHLTATAGLRGIAVDGSRVLLNGEPLFQRLVLDQGFYPDGILTAPTDADLVRDIELSLAAGFNGARLHQKVFEERFLHHADRLGYLVWGEFPDWPALGYHRSRQERARAETHHLEQWMEVLDRDYSHPSIIGWCPLNETAWQADVVTDALRSTTRALFLATKQADPTRPVIDASGFAHTESATDLFDLHDYEQDPERLRAKFERGADAVGAQPTDQRSPNIPHTGQPLFLSEFGGARWPVDARTGPEAWGYGDAPPSEAAFLERFAALCRVARETPGMAGYCYTQLTDVFQEQNGLHTFHRQPKFDPARLRAAQTSEPSR